MRGGSIFILRRGFFGFRKDDVVAALEEQRRQIDGLAQSVDRLWREKERAWRVNHAASRELLVQKTKLEEVERARGADSETARSLQELSRKLDEALALRARLVETVERPAPDTRPPIMISEPGLNGVLRRRVERHRAS